MPTFIETLLAPAPQTVKEKKLWSIGLYTGWKPLIAGLKATGQLSDEEMPLAALGHMEGYNGLDKNGHAKTRIAEPVRLFQRKITENIRQRFEADAEGLIEQAGPKYDEVLKAAHEAARPLVEKELAAFEKDVLAFNAEQEAAAAEAAQAAQAAAEAATEHTEEPAPKPRRVGIVQQAERVVKATKKAPQAPPAVAVAA